MKEMIRTALILTAPLIIAAGCAHAPRKTESVVFPPAIVAVHQPGAASSHELAAQDTEVASVRRDQSSSYSALADSVSANIDGLQSPLQMISVESMPVTAGITPVSVSLTDAEGISVVNVLPVSFHEDHLREHERRPKQIDLGLGTIPRSVNSCGFSGLESYRGLATEFESEPESQTGVVPPVALSSWWEMDLRRPIRHDSMPISLNLEELMVRALANSKYVQSLADLPLIREKAIIEAEAEFDVKTFMETRFNRPSEPVGNQLTVGPGGSNRYRQEDFTQSGGIARKTVRGGRVQLAQQIGLYSNNSTFIDPEHQGNAQLTLNLTQPLLSGSGKTYNTSLIMLAKLDEKIAWDEVSAQLQDYLVDVTEAYWQLYLERSRLQQKKRHLQRGESILAELTSRGEIDVVDNQIARARAAVATRRSELIRAKTSVRNAESRLRGLINDPELYGSSIEVVPQESPNCDRLGISVRDAMSQALESRSEIDQSIQKVRAAGIRLKVAKNELMPILDFVLETYLSGLQGQNNIGQAWVDQFSVGEPSYSAGMRYEIPINNRAAKSRHDRRRLELRQAISQFEFNVEELMSEVDIAVREVDTTFAEMLSRHEAMTANETDLNYFEKRWELLPGDDRSSSFLLEDILEAQDRVAAEEANFVLAQVNYAMSLVELKRAIGILLQSEQIETGRGCNAGLEQLMFHKTQTLISEEPAYRDDQSLPAPAFSPVVIEELDLTPVTEP